MDEVGYRERHYSLKFRYDAGFQWRYDDNGEPAHEMVFTTVRAAQAWHAERFGKHHLTITPNGAAD